MRLKHIFGFVVVKDRLTEKCKKRRNICTERMCMLDITVHSVLIIALLVFDKD